MGLLPAGAEFRGECDDIPGLMAEADMLALTSDHEGLPNVILEAMGQGTPVLCTDLPVLAEVTAGAAVLAPADVDTWTDRLAELLTDADRRTALVPAGLARAAELTWERCVRATHAVYQEAAAKAANSLP